MLNLSRNKFGKDLVANFWPMLPFYTSGVFRGYKMGTLARNGSNGVNKNRLKIFVNLFRGSLPLQSKCRRIVESIEINGNKFQSTNFIFEICWKSTLKTWERLRWWCLSRQLGFITYGCSRERLSESCAHSRRHNKLWSQFSPSRHWLCLLHVDASH